MFRAFTPIIRITRFRLAAYGILSYLQLGGGGKSSSASRLCGADAPHKRLACLIPKATSADTGCVILIAFSLQQWWHERSSMLLYKRTLLVVHTHTHTHTHTYIYTYIYIYIHTYISYIYVYTHIYKCILIPALNAVQ
jgi:hypothetical protein